MTTLQPSLIGDNSVIGESPYSPGSSGAYSDYILLAPISAAADGIIDWGYQPRQRDISLRHFWPTEPTLAGVIYSTVSRYAAFQWSLSGPPRMVDMTQNMLQSCERGAGWAVMMTKFLEDVFTQDNGGFLEVVRAKNDPSSPVVSLNHLDSGLCTRTGKWDYPVVYTDPDNRRNHLLPWYSVIPFTEMASPNKLARGMQFCALTRILRLSQIMRDVTTYKREKVSGRFTKRLHLVGGVQTRTIEDALKKTQDNADNLGLTKYITNAVLGSLDPKATVSHEVIDFAELPSDWDEEVAMKWYVTNLALCFGTDYQDYAPMPGGGIGSGNQAKVQSEKSRGKGPALFMTLLEQVMNFHGVIPRSVRFKMGEVDIAVEMEKTMLRKERALERQIKIDSGEITTEVARQMAVDCGDMDPRYLIFMQERDATNETTVLATQPRVPDDEIGTGMPGPLEPPGKIPAPVNDNQLKTKPPSQSQKVVV